MSNFIKTCRARRKKESFLKPFFILLLKFFSISNNVFLQEYIIKV